MLQTQRGKMNQNESKWLNNLNSTVKYHEVGSSSVWYTGDVFLRKHVCRRDLCRICYLNLPNISIQDPKIIKMYPRAFLWKLLHHWIFSGWDPMPVAATSQTAEDEVSKIVKAFIGGTIYDLWCWQLQIHYELKYDRYTKAIIFIACI